MYVGKHYSGVNSPKEFGPLMRKLAAALPVWRVQYGVELWLVSGKSGIVAMAGVSVLGSDEPFCSIRKPGEDSHGGTFEGNCEELAVHRTEYDQPLRVGIVDDFIGGGDTVRRMMGQIEARTKVELAVVVAYRRLYDGGHQEMTGISEYSVPYLSSNHFEENGTVWIPDSHPGL